MIWGAFVKKEHQEKTSLGVMGIAFFGWPVIASILRRGKVTRKMAERRERSQINAEIARGCVYKGTAIISIQT